MDQLLVVSDSANSENSRNNGAEIASSPLPTNYDNSGYIIFKITHLISAIFIIIF